MEHEEPHHGQHHGLQIQRSHGSTVLPYASFSQVKEGHGPSGPMINTLEVERFENRSGVRELGSFNNCTSRKVLDVLKQL